MQQMITPRALRCRPLATVAVMVVLGVPTPMKAQGIPKHEYLRYVPLEVPRLTKQTPTRGTLNLSAALSL